MEFEQPRNIVSSADPVAFLKMNAFLAMSPGGASSWLVLFPVAPFAGVAHVAAHRPPHARAVTRAHYVPDRPPREAADAAPKRLPNL
jgi:hypothetical protein